MDSKHFWLERKESYLLFQSRSSCLVNGTTALPSGVTIDNQEGEVLLLALLKNKSLRYVLEDGLTAFSAFSALSYRKRLFNSFASTY